MVKCEKCPFLAPLYFQILAGTLNKKVMPHLVRHTEYERPMSWCVRLFRYDLVYVVTQTDIHTKK
jgi:hypothetical protein